jgi:FkbM family methyltransferase
VTTRTGTRCLEDLRGKRVEFPDEPGLEPFVRSALRGEDYPVVFPDVFRPATIVDVGAHVGSAALYFRHVYPGARILSFEPSPASFEYLSRNVRGESGMEIRRVAVGAEDSRMQLWAGAYSSMQASLLPTEESGRESVTVEVRAIGPLLGELGVDRISILKVDTEGMELPILRALDDALADVEVIHLEYHSDEDRRDLDALLSPGHVHLASRASEPDRGTVTYVQRAALALWRARTRAPRFTFPKRGAVAGGARVS